VSNYRNARKHGFVVHMLQNGTYKGEHHDYPETIHVTRDTPEEALAGIKANVDAYDTDNAIRTLVASIQADPTRAPVIIAQLANGQTALEPGAYLNAAETTDLYSILGSWGAPAKTTAQLDAWNRLWEALEGVFTALGVGPDAEQLETKLRDFAAPDTQPTPVSLSELNDIRRLAEKAHEEWQNSDYFGRGTYPYRDGVEGGLGGHIGKLAGTLTPPFVLSLIDQASLPLTVPNPDHVPPVSDGR
jgi:hypothetical protein